MAIRSLLLAILAVSAADPAQGQVHHLTPDVAKELLKAAEVAREDWGGDPMQAARAFRMSFLRRYPPASPCSGMVFKTDMKSSVYSCVFGPASWYAERLASALRADERLEAVEVQDLVAVVLVPWGTRLDAPERFTVCQGQVPGHRNCGFSDVKVLTAVAKEKSSLETLDAVGNPVLRVVTTFYFRPDAFDARLHTTVDWVLDGMQRWYGITPSYLKDIR